jgi:hypothetical protein
MRIGLNPSALTKTKWHDYAVRFLFGGSVTVVAGLIVKKFGPSIGGLFLAFPAIFPASATLIEKHEIQKKQAVGLVGRARGRKAVAVDAAGASMGSVGLLGFAFLTWLLLPNNPAPLVLGGATIAWLLLSASLWKIRRVIL